MQGNKALGAAAYEPVAEVTSTTVVKTTRNEKLASAHKCPAQ